jgi:hypothetical protein
MDAGDDKQKIDLSPEEQPTLITILVAKLDVCDKAMRSCGDHSEAPLG